MHGRKDVLKVHRYLVGKVLRIVPVLVEACWENCVLEEIVMGGLAEFHCIALGALALKWDTCKFSF